MVLLIPAPGPVSADHDGGLDCHFQCARYVGMVPVKEAVQCTDADVSFPGDSGPPDYSCIGGFRMSIDGDTYKITLADDVHGDVRASYHHSGGQTGTFCNSIDDLTLPAGTLTVWIIPSPTGISVPDIPDLGTPCGSSGGSAGSASLART